MVKPSSEERENEMSDEMSEMSGDENVMPSDRRNVRDVSDA